jgi:integrase
MREADELAVKLRNGSAPTTGLTLGYLKTEYLTHVTPDKAPSTQAHDRTCAEMFRRAFGAEMNPRDLGEKHWRRFIRERRSGVLRPVGRLKPGAVRDRIIQYDLKFLLSVLNYATHASNGRGGELLDRNPLGHLLAKKKIAMPSEAEPYRPAITESEYRAVLERAPEIHPHLVLAMVICYETGHRIGSVHRLSWADVDLEKDVITWPAPHEKNRRSHQSPVSPELHNVLVIEREATGGKGWLFPSPLHPDRPRERGLFHHWFPRAEKLAGVQHVARRQFHAFRRKLANDLNAKGASPSVIAAVGGWHGTQALEQCYIQPSIEDARAALAHRSTNSK